MKTAIDILPFSAGDENGIALIEAECFSKPWSKKTILGEASGQSLFLTAKHKNAVVGYISFRSVLDEGYINNIAVTAKFRRLGIAGMLLEKARSAAVSMGLSFLTLEVRSSNTAAVSLYLKNGYKQTGRRRGFYTDPPEDALLLTLELGDKHENSCH